MRTDLWVAWRVLRRDWRLSLLAALAFGMAIAAMTIVYGVVHAILLEQAGWKDAASMVRVLGSKRSSAGTRPNWESLSWAAYSELREHKNLFRDTAAARKMIFTVTRVPVADQVFGYMVTGNYFGLLSGHPLLGRTLHPHDEDEAAPAVAVISFEAWRRLFAKDPAVLGKHATVDGTPCAIVGVMRPDFVFPGDRPLVWTTLRHPVPDLGVDVVARLGATVPSLGVWRLGPDRNEQIRIQHWRDAPDGKVRGTLLVCFGLVSSLAFLGCINVAALMLARSAGRVRQQFIQVATGATHGRLMRQMLLEALILAGAGAILALPASQLTLDQARDWALRMPTGLNNAAAIGLSPGVLLASFAIALVAALLGASAPIVSSLSLDFTQPIRSAGYGGSMSRESGRTFSLLIAVEAAMAVTLLVTAGLFAHSLLRLLGTDHGFLPEHVLTMRLPVGSIVRLRLNAGEDRAQEARYRELLALAQSTPGVESAALTSTLPLSHVAVSTRFRQPSPSGEPTAAVAEALSEAVTADFFRTLRMPLLSGRLFEREDDAAVSRNVIVNGDFERKFFGGRAVGQLLYSENSSLAPDRIIGVVKDSAFIDYDEEPLPALYLPFAKRLVLPLTGMVVRSRTDPAHFLRTLQLRLQAAQPNQAIVQVRTLTSMVDESTWFARLSTWLFQAFAALALLLASTGIFGVVMYRTTLRRRETGIRLALGAQYRELWGRSIAVAQIPVLIGLTVGVLVSLAVAHGMRSLLYQATPVDVGALVGSALFLIAASVIATAIPAAMVFRNEPSVILRNE